MFEGHVAAAAITDVVAVWRAVRDALVPSLRHHRLAAGAAPARMSGDDPADRPAPERTPPRAPMPDGGRSYRAAVWWVVWLLLALLMALFLTFAAALPSHAQVEDTMTVPDTPHESLASAGNSQVVLTWEEPDDIGGTPVTRYDYRHAEGASVPDETAWSSAGLSLTVTVSDLANGTAYAFGVRAVNDVGEGEAATASATPATVPGAPVNLTAVPDDRQMKLTWEAPADDGGSEVFATYEYSYHPVGKEEEAQAGLSGSLTLILRELTNGTEYLFMVRAENAVGTGAWATATATVAALPDPPQNLAATPSDGQMTLTWEAPASDGGAAIARYDHSYHKVRGGGVTEVTGDLSLTATVTGLANGTEYNFLVWAVNSTGAGQWAIVRGTPADIPGAPQNLTATPYNGLVVLDWEAPASDGGAAIEHYEYRYAAGSSVPVDAEWTAAGQQPLPLFDLTNGTAYTFEVRALTRRDARGLVAGRSDTGSRLDSELGYGLRAPARHGVVTPYAGLSVADDGGRTWRVGTRWTVAAELSLGVEASHTARGGDRAEQALVLRAAARW